MECGLFLTSYLSWATADKSLLSAFVCFWKARIFGGVSESPGCTEFHWRGGQAGLGCAGTLHHREERKRIRAAVETRSAAERCPVSIADVAQGPERPVRQV